jgi:uncharacterized protein (DUF58 family)
VAFGLFLIMMVTGVAYENNLIFMMAFLCISMGLIAILQTARNLRDVQVVAIHVPSEFGGTTHAALLSLRNTSPDPKINLEVQGSFAASDETVVASITFNVTSLEPNAMNSFETAFALPNQRGRYLLRRVRLATTAPYGLFRAWIYVDLQSDFISFPVPKGSRELPKEQASVGEDFSGHKLYAPGDPMTRIDWKVYSRRRNHYVKEFHHGGQPRIEFSLGKESGHVLEVQLSQLSLWINEAYHRQFDFQLKTKNHATGFGHDVPHYHRCLTELALWTG